MKILPPIEPQDTMLSAMAYPFWFVICPYILLTEKKEEPFMRFQAIQALILGSASLLVALFAVIIGFILFQGAPSVTDIMGGPQAQSASMTDYRETNVNIHNDSYITQGCASMVTFSLLMLVVGAIFLFILYCASRVWKGEFLSLPFIGKYIEDKYFSDFVGYDEINK